MMEYPDTAAHTFIVPRSDFGFRPFPESVPPAPMRMEAGEDDTLTMDVPSFRSLSGTIIVLIFIMLAFSVIICLGRSDFNFILYLLGYYIWCIESDKHRDRAHEKPAGQGMLNISYYCSRNMYRNVYQYTIALSIASLLDSFWTVIGINAWLCDPKDASCVSSKENLSSVLYMHRFVVVLSTFNLLLKVVTIVLSSSWLQQQKKVVAGTNHPTWAM
eukprot:Trichotokara_eunicae@DN9534_c0_g1_i1.p1